MDSLKINISPINDSRTTIGKRLEPKNYSDSKIQSISLDEIIIHFHKIPLNDIPTKAIVKLKKAINPNKLTKRFKPQVLVALSDKFGFTEELLIFFKYEIINGLQTIISQSNNKNEINMSKNLLDGKFSKYIIEKETNSNKEKVTKTLEYTEIKYDLLNSIIEYSENNNIEIRNKDNSNGKNYNLTYFRSINILINNKEISLSDKLLINTLKDLFRINPEMIAKNIFINHGSFTVNKKLAIFIEYFLKLKEENFPELDNISKELSISKSELLSVIKYNYYYSVEKISNNFIQTKITQFILNKNKLYLHFGKVNTI